LIAFAFFLARGFIKTGLGNRIAYKIVSMFGQTTLGLTYSLVMAEALLSPAIPSLAARAGGIFLPLAKVRARSQRRPSPPFASTLCGWSGVATVSKTLRS
jgi:di/tricarboxylate transporter